MKSFAPLLTRSLNSNYFHLVLLCGIVLAFLLTMISSVTNTFTGLIPTLAIPGSFLFFIFFIIPGYLTARQFVIRNIIDKKYLLLLSIVMSSLIAFVVLWIYFFNHIVGRIFSVAIVLSCAVILVLQFRKFKHELLDKNFIEPLTIMFFAGCMYLGILYLYYTHDFISASNFRFVHDLPGDNILPYIFLDRLYYGLPLTNFAEGWLSSDRPPLFSGMLLIVRPMAIFVDSTLFYQFVGTFVQCLWIPAMYSLCKFFSFDKKIRAFIIGSSVFSGVFIINSTYLWPKLSTTLFFTLLFLLVFELSDNPKLTKKTISISILIGICAALGVLSHGGIAFSFIALILALIITEKRMVFIKHAVFAILPFVIVYLPWILYQELVDPPGNLLTKWHFAGMAEINDYTFLEALYVSYAQRPLEDIFNKTIANILYMFADFPGGYASMGALRGSVFFRLFGMATILNVFLIILAFYFLKRFCFEQKQMSYVQKIMFYFTFFSFTVWPLLMYSYGVTHLNLSSYANIILIYLLIAFGAKHTNKELRNLVYILNILLFAVLWILPAEATVFTIFSDMSRRMLAVTIVSAIMFLAYLHKPKARG